MRRRHARRNPLDRPRHGRNVIRRGAAAAADNVDQPVLGKAPDDFGRFLGLLVVLAKRIGQAGVGVTGNQAVAQPRQFGHVGAHFLAAQGAVEADRQRLGVAHRGPERFGHLPGKRAPRGIGDRARDDHRITDPAFLKKGLAGKDRGLGVERVEDGFDHQHIDAPFGQCPRLLQIGVDQLLKGHVALAGIVHVRADAGRAVGRANGAHHEPGTLRRGDRVGRLACQARRRHVHLVAERLHVVVGHRDLLRVEGVGLDQIGARLEIGAVDVTNQIGLGQHQQVVVALQIVRPVGKPLAAIVGLAELVALNHGAHGAVEHEDAALQRGVKFGVAGMQFHGSPDQNSRAFYPLIRISGYQAQAAPAGRPSGKPPHPSPRRPFGEKRMAGCSRRLAVEVNPPPRPLQRLSANPASPPLRRIELTGCALSLRTPGFFLPDGRLPPTLTPIVPRRIAAAHQPCQVPGMMRRTEHAMVPARGHSACQQSPKNPAETA